jgi:hypothetical protein
MTDPVYSYVKGVGWVPSTEFHHYRTYKDTAYKLIIERRPPNPGECGFWVLKAWTIEQIVYDIQFYPNSGTFGWVCVASDKVHTNPKDIWECITIYSKPI